MSGAGMSGASVSGANRRRSWMILGPTAASIAFVLELTLVPLLLPSLQRDFAVSLADLAWVFNAYGIAVACGVALSASFGDSFDLRKLVAIGIAFFAVGAAAVAMSTSFDMLLAARALQGFGAGLFTPLLPILLTQAAPKRPGRVLIVWGSISGYIAAIAPYLHGQFFEQFGWPPAFALLAVLAALAGLALFLTPRLTTPAQAASPLPPILERAAQLLRSGGLWLMFLYVFCTYGAVTYYLFIVPVWFDQAGVDIAQMGFVLSLAWLSYASLSTALRNVVDGPRLSAVMLSAPGLITLGLIFAYFCEDAYCQVLSALFLGAGLACSNTPSTQVILKLAPEGMRAVSTSLDITFARLGGAVTVALLARSGLSLALVAVVTLAVVAVLSGALALRAASTRPA